jgi:hypothetical protein
MGGSNMTHITAEDECYMIERAQAQGKELPEIKTKVLVRWLKEIQQER